MVRERDVSPGPWMGRKGEDPGADSAVGLEKERRSSGFGAHDIWKSDEKTGEQPPAKPDPRHESRYATESESSTRPVSPDVPPPGSALRAEDRPEAVRSASKVQELVNMYDGIAKKSVSPPQTALISPPLQKLGDTVDEEEEEWGAAQTLDNVPSVEVPESTESEAAAVGNGWPEDTTIEVQAIPSPPPPRPQIPDLQISIDLSHLDSLFPSTAATFAPPEPLPDTIIDDTFANISERKTWYRISRFGSMRKHNHGNDDDYIRMDWAHSAARDKSLRIVRRWMEEDSIAGRVSLGARHKGAAAGSMFNWDSKAEPVDMGELLGKKRGHQRGGSKGSRGSKGDVNSPAGASFGWSSQTASPTGTSFPAPFETKLNGPTEAKSRPQSLFMPPLSGVMKPTDSTVQAKTRPKSLIMPPTRAMGRPSIDQALATSSLTATRENSQSTLQPIQNDDDDDWGEMVSSPTVPTSGNPATTTAEAPPVDKFVDQEITSPSAASFGWNENSSPSHMSQEQPKATVGVAKQASATNFGWDDFEQPLQSPNTSLEQPKSPLKAEPQPNSATFEWDHFEQPSPVQNIPLEQPQTLVSESRPSSAKSGWDAFEKPTQDSSKAALTVGPQPSAATFGWDDFEKPAQTLPRAASVAHPQSSEPIFGWDDFEKPARPSQDAVKPASRDEQRSGGTMFEWDQASSVAPDKKIKETQTSTPPAAPGNWTPEPKETTTSHKHPTSPTITSPLSSPPQIMSFSNPVEATNSPPPLPQPAKSHSRTPSQTKTDDEAVAKILHALPDLTYMLR